MVGHMLCEYCGERFSDAAKARSHSGQHGHQVRPLKPDEYDQPAASEPLSGYDADTTGDYRQLAVDAVDEPTHVLTNYIARVTTRAGGRIPMDFAADVTRRTGSLECEWTVYAPAPNPFHVAAVVVDLLVEVDDVNDVQVDINDRTPAAITETIRGNRMYFEFEVDEYGELERTIRELRWQGGVDDDSVTPLEHLDIADHNDIRHLATAPGDAWDHHTVTISIHQPRDFEGYP